jgi:glutamate decarboxylase
MVHLNRVATEKEVNAAKGVVDGMNKFTLAVEDEPDDYTATVYGSKYAAEDLPRHDMPVRCRPTPSAAIVY